MNLDFFEILEHTLIETAEIGAFIFVALLAMDLIHVRTGGRMAQFLMARPGTQYLVSGLLGAVPGCEGVYFGISLHTHGLISLGALVTAFIATTGDEAFVMLSTMPLETLYLTVTLLAIGCLVGWGVDRIRVMRSGEAIHLHCDEEIFHPGVEFSARHYLTVHVWQHIIRQHMVKILLWTSAAIFTIEVAGHYYDLRALVSEQPLLVLLLAAAVGLIPQSGPNLIFVAMYVEQTIPFSVLFTNMLVQSGHALLPLLSISLRDSVIIKVIALGVGVVLGMGLWAVGF